MIHKVGDRVSPRREHSRYEPFIDGEIVRESDIGFDWIVRWPNGVETAARDYNLVLTELISPVNVEDIPMSQWNLPAEWSDV